MRFKHKFLIQILSLSSRPIRNKSFSTASENVENISSRKYEPIIGLEVHAQMLTESKLFSSASTKYLSRPNSQVTYFDVSLPGTMPVLNRNCVEIAVKTALSLNCRISLKSSFDRKHYFYGDMPNGYQITQQNNPIAKDGYIDFIVYDESLENSETFEPYLKRCRLKQIQIEQDSGKSLVDEDNKINLIDLNRAGVPLMEFVFEPDLHSSLEAVSLARELILILKSLEVCSCKMDEGAFRIDANVSIRPFGSKSLGTRTEIKNLNSFRFLRGAIMYEIQRQSKILDEGGVVINETLGYEIRTKQTFLMRDKEIVQDYRFMPEPNLPPIILAEYQGEDIYLGPQKSLISVEKSRETLPELPEQIRDRLSKQPYCLNLKEIFILQNDRFKLNIFEQIFAKSNRKIGSECFQLIQRFLRPIFEDRINPLTAVDLKSLDPRISLTNIEEFIQIANLAEICDMLFGECISEATTFDLLMLYCQRDQRSARKIIEENNWWLIKDQDEIEKVCLKVIESIPKIAKKYAKNGIRKPKSMLIQRAFVLMNNQVNENIVWDCYDRILRPNNQIKTKQKSE